MNTHTISSNKDVVESTTSLEKDIYKKVVRKIIPLLMVCYLAAYLDRVNVGFAKLQMLNDLAFSEAIYGFGAGIFFIGYFLFEVPSNIILHKVGARIWITRIMITWAIISASFAFITSPTMFYVMRFLLGMAEAGFAPGVILYLTYWFPTKQRAKALSIFFMAIPLAGIIGGPLSGFIMDYFNGMHGWAGWKWLFVIEAIPSLVLGFVVFKYLNNSIDDAKWLSPQEKRFLKNEIAKDNSSKTVHKSIKGFLQEKKLWIMAAVYFCIVIGQYGITFWLPTIIKNSGVNDPLKVGILTALPYICTIIFLPIVGTSSDKKNERRWHLAIPMAISATAFLLLPLAQSTTISVLILCFATTGILIASSLFWSLPTAVLSGISAAAGIAAVNSIANLAGFFSPAIVGWLNQITKHETAGLIFIASCILVGIILIFQISSRSANK